MYTGDTNPKLLVNGYRLVSLSQWSPAPLSLVSNEQETHQCEAIVVKDQKSCQNFDLRAGRSWRGCRDRWCPSSCPSNLPPFFAHSPTRSPLWMTLRDHCWPPRCHSQVISITARSSWAPHLLALLNRVRRSRWLGSFLTTRLTWVAEHTWARQSVTYFMQSCKVSVPFADPDFLKKKILFHSDPMNMERKQWYGEFRLETINEKI